MELPQLWFLFFFVVDAHGNMSFPALKTPFASKAECLAEDWRISKHLGATVYATGCMTLDRFILTTPERSIDTHTRL